MSLSLVNISLARQIIYPWQLAPGLMSIEFWPKLV
jgi:hypothetical protein